MASLSLENAYPFDTFIMSLAASVHRVAGLLISAASMAYTTVFAISNANVVAVYFIAAIGTWRLRWVSPGLRVD